jgi:TetR/AcrR family transcriptional regulator, cholesterol catabolism regulator
MPKGRSDDDELSGRQREKWLRRQREIYEVAARVFHEKGYEQTSMDDIAEAVGLLKGSLYHYIDSKEDLLYGIAKAVNKVVADRMAYNESLEGPAIERLRVQFHGHTLTAAHDLDFLTLVQVYYHEFRSLTREHQEEVMELRRSYQTYTSDRIRLAQSEGSVCPDLDADVIAPAILTLLNGVLLAYRTGRHPDWDHLADNYTEFIMQGLRCPPEHTHRPPARRRPVTRANSGTRRRRAQPAS